MKREIFYDLLHGGKLPGLAALFNGGVKVRYGNTVYPSETLPSQASLFTGSAVRRHGIVGNVWLDRTTDPPAVKNFTSASGAAAVYGYGLWGAPTGFLPLRDSVGMLNRELDPGAPTLYEVAGEAGLTSTVVFNQYSRGATRWIRPGRAAVMYFAMAHKLHAGEPAFDSHTTSVSLAHIRKHGLPNLMTIYFPGLDAWGHHTGDRAQAEYITKFLEPQVMKIVRAIDAMKLLDGTVFALTSDHGQAWVGADAGLITLETLARALEKKGYSPSITPETALRGDCFITVVGGCAHVYVKAGRDTGWRPLPSVERLLPAAECLSRICAEEYPAKDSADNGPALVLARVSTTDPYMVYSRGELVAPDKFFWNSCPEHPFINENINGLNCMRSGDIVVFSDFEKGCYISDGPWTRGHGGLSTVDTGIPIIFSGPGIPNRVIERASIIDIAPTILGLMDVRTNIMDGRDLRLRSL